MSEKIIKTPSGMKLVDILQTIRNETQPIDGHPDPGALDDCWNEVFETIQAVGVMLDELEAETGT